MELKPWSMNFFVRFTLFDALLPSCISWWNSSKFVQKKKNWVQMSDKVEISGSNSSKLSSEVSPSTIFYYVMPPWYSRQVLFLSNFTFDMGNLLWSPPLRAFDWRGLAQSCHYFALFRGTCGHGGDGKTLLTQCSKTFDARNPLPVIPTTQQWDRWREVKVLKEDLQICAWLQFRYGDKLANCLERIFFRCCQLSCVL